jgi:hypothetical protein
MTPAWQAAGSGLYDPANLAELVMEDLSSLRVRSHDSVQRGIRGGHEDHVIFLTGNAADPSDACVHGDVNTEHQEHRSECSWQEASHSSLLTLGHQRYSSLAVSASLEVTGAAELPSC